MSESEVQRIAPIAWRSWHLRTSLRLTNREAGDRLGIDRMTVAHHCYRIRKLLGKTAAASTPTEPRDTADLSEVRRRNGARCRCGLLMPCARCLPTLYEMAASRQGDATGLT